MSHSVVSDSLRPHESQHARPPCPTPTPGTRPNSCPLSQWCSHPREAAQQMSRETEKSWSCQALPKGKILSHKNDCCFKPLSLELVCNTYRKLIHLIVLQAFTSGGVQQSAYPKLLQMEKKMGVTAFDNGCNGWKEEWESVLIVHQRTLGSS